MSAVEDVLGLLGLAGLAVGLAIVPPSLAFDPVGAAGGILGQLPATLLAAVVTVVAAAANIGAGAILVRLALRRPFRSWTESILLGFLGAVSLDLVLLGALAGRWAWFTAPVLLVIHGVILVVGWRVGRPLIAPPPPAALRPPAAPRPPATLRPPAAQRRASDRSGWALGRPSMLWVLVVVVWSGPVLLQLASPVVPFFDVLPNHVAPVEHLETFGRFDPLTTSPSPAYGPSRLSLGYISLLGTITTLTGLPAALSVSAFIVVEVVLVAVGVRAVAHVMGGGRAGLWALLAFALTQPFARLTDDRSRLVALPLACLVLVLLVRACRTRGPSARLGVRADATLLGAAIGATLLMHAVIGAFAALTVLLVIAWSPARAARVGVPALAAGVVLVIPQVLVMLDVPLSPVGLVVMLPAALVGSAVAARPGVVRVAVVLIRVGVIGILAGMALGVLARPVALESLWDTLTPMGVLILIGVMGLIVRGRVATPVVLASALAAGVLPVVMVGMIPADVAIATDVRSLVLDSIAFEIPKEAATWLPFVLALGVGLVIDALLQWAMIQRDLVRRMAPVALMGVLMVIAALPWHAVPIDPYHVGEHRTSESMAISLRWAEQGYWEGYPDVRRLIDGQQLELLDALRTELTAGRITAETEVLHVASGSRQLVATPIGVFTGIIETTLAPDVVASGHSLGARLHPLSELDAHLGAEASGRRYLVLESSGLPDSVRASIVAHGFTPVVMNDRTTLFVRPAADGAMGSRSHRSGPADRWSPWSSWTASGMRHRERPARGVRRAPHPSCGPSVEHHVTADDGRRTASGRVVGAPACGYGVSARRARSNSSRVMSPRWNRAWSASRPSCSSSRRRSPSSRRVPLRMTTNATATTSAITTSTRMPSITCASMRADRRSIVVTV